MHQRKNLPVGDGGIIYAKDFQIQEKLRRLRSFGDIELSYNYRMTEFAAAIGRVRLKKLKSENEVRSRRAHEISYLLKDNSRFRVRLMDDADINGYHAVLLEIREQIDSNFLDKGLSIMQSKGLPIRKTWEPLHKHPHFNPQEEPARGLPWRHSKYCGKMKNSKYNEIRLPVVEYYCPNLILELYVHPTIPDPIFESLIGAIRIFDD